ncbi:MAG: aminotransferase class I/II-fold pyridoxal phosphate-dependent enzyme [Kiritimatiellia bacterium]
MSAPNKKNVGDLAVCGGRPAFAQPLHIGRPNIGSREQYLARINQMLDACWLTNNGPLVQEFEKRIADHVGVRHCIAVCNATVAMEIAIRAAGLKGEVIIPSFTFVATAHALQWQEITPVFCDIDPQTHNIDPDLIESLITPRTTGIIGVHIWGRPCNIGRLDEIARKHKLTLMFDAAHAFGCSFRGRPIGQFGLAEVYSFHATKFFNSLEGGAIVTNDDELANKIRLMKNFGFYGYDNVIHLGTNGKMVEASAAMGLTNLDHLDDFLRVNRENYAAYRAGLAGVPGLKLVEYDERDTPNYQYIVLEMDERVTGLSRDHLIAVLHAEKVLARRYFYPGCHRMEPYRTLYPEAGKKLPATDTMCGRVVILPTGTAVSPKEIAVVCEIIRVAIESTASLQVYLETGRENS